ncbi:MAG TPA: multidrug efflux SMR transporter [Pseudogracilibacillus sp.]|nr:multidrug efflux SMR transporter [Pseudogracilibacillus sp.]
MAWLYLVVASLGEIFGVISINLFLKVRNVFWFVCLVLSFAFGFFLLSLAVQEIPLGTAYAIWTGLGATGAVLIGIVFFKESSSVLRLLFLTCIIGGAVGLKLLS